MGGGRPPKCFFLEPRLLLLLQINVKKLQFIQKLTASDTSKTAKITKRFFPHQHIA